MIDSDSRSDNEKEKKFSIPCKYFLSGLCQKNEKCRFLHIHPEEHFKYKKSIPGIRQFHREILNDQSRYFLQRRPLLHLIVLFASDVRVKQYADELVRDYTRDGINCYLQTHTDEKKFIKPENLVKLIGQSIAHYLVVIGDRNMKNQTIQARKNGKLVPVPVREEKKFIIQEWGKRKKKDLLDHVENMSPNQVLTLFSELIGHPNLHKRFQTLYDIVKNYGRKQRLIPKQNFEELIFLHSSTHQGINIINEIPADDRYGGDSKVGLNLSLIAEQEKQIGISTKLKNKLLKYSKSLLSKIASLGPRLTNLHNQARNNLWDMYYYEFQQSPSAAHQNFVLNPLSVKSIERPKSNPVDERKSWVSMVQQEGNIECYPRSQPLDINPPTWNEFNGNSYQPTGEEESKTVSLASSIGSNNSFSPVGSPVSQTLFGSNRCSPIKQRSRTSSFYSNNNYVSSPEVSWSLKSTTSYDPWEEHPKIRSEIRNEMSSQSSLSSGNHQSVMLPNDLWEDNNVENLKSGIFQMDDSTWDPQPPSNFQYVPKLNGNGTFQNFPQHRQGQRLSINSPAFQPAPQRHLQYPSVIAGSNYNMN